MRNKKDIIDALLWYTKDSSVIYKTKDIMWKNLLARFGKKFFVEHDSTMKAPASINVKRNRVRFNVNLIFAMLVKSYDNWKDLYPSFDDGVFVNEIWFLAVKFLVTHEGNHQEYSMAFDEAWNIFLDFVNKNPSYQHIPTTLVSYSLNVVDDSKIDTLKYVQSRSQLEKDIIREGINLFRTVSSIDDMVKILQDHNYSIRGHLLFLLDYRFCVMGLNKKHLDKDKAIQLAMQDDRFVFTKEVFELFDSILSESDTKIRTTRTVTELVPMLWNLFLYKCKQEIEDAAKGNGSLLDAQKIIDQQQTQQSQQSNDDSSNSSGSSSSEDSDSNSEDGSDNEEDSDGNSESELDNGDSSADASSDDADGSKEEPDVEDEGEENVEDEADSLDKELEDETEEANGSDGSGDDEDDEDEDEDEDAEDSSSGSSNSEDGSDNDEEGSSDENSNSNDTSDSSNQNGGGNDAPFDSKSLERMAEELLKEVLDDICDENGDTDTKNDRTTENEKKQLKSDITNQQKAMALSGVDCYHYKMSNVCNADLNSSHYFDYQKSLRNVYNKKPIEKSGYQTGEFDENLIERLKFERDINVFSRTTAFKKDKNIFVTFIIDVSGSMDDKIPYIRSIVPELSHALESIHIKTRIFIFSDDSYLIKDFDDKLILRHNQSNLKTIFNRVTDLGCTDPSNALGYLICDSYDYNAMHNNEQILIFITDGLVDGDVEDICKARFEKLKSLNYKIFPVGLELDDREISALEDLTGANVYNYKGSNMYTELGNDLKQFIIKNIML